MALHYKKIKPKLIKLKILKNKNISKKYLLWLNDKEVTKHTDLIFEKHTYNSIKKYVSQMYKDKNMPLCIANPLYSTSRADV